MSELHPHASGRSAAFESRSAADSLTKLARDEKQGSEGLRRRLTYLMLFRVVLISIVLGATTLLYWIGDVDLSQPSSLTIYAIVGGTYLLTIFYALYLRSLLPLSRLVTLQLTGDLAIATILVHITGGAQSAYTFFFPLAIVGSAVLRFRRGALMVAPAAALLFLSISLLGWFELLPTPAGQRVMPSSATALELGRYIALNLAAIVGVGALAFNLGGQLQRTSAHLEKQRSAAADLLTLHEDIVHCLTSGLVTVDSRSQILTFNRAAQEILGMSAKQAIGHRLGEISPALAELLEKTPENRPSRRAEVTQPMGSGELILGASVSPLYDHTYRTIGRILNFQDLTEMRRMEEHVSRAERLAVIGGLAAGVAHEIRNPLASISGSIELLSNSPTTDDDSRALMGIVTREIERLNKLVTEFLEYAHPRSPTLAPLELPPLIEDTVRVFVQDPRFERVELSFEKPETEPAHPLRADASKLRQLLWNLLRNAAEAASAGGHHVRLSLEWDEIGAILRIRDDGPGIPRESFDRIFDPFFTTKARGSGLGLATVHGIVRDHGGTLRAENEESGGACFTARLPYNLNSDD